MKKLFLVLFIAILNLTTASNTLAQPTTNQLLTSFNRNVAIISNIAQESFGKKAKDIVNQCYKQDLPFFKGRTNEFDGAFLTAKMQKFPHKTQKCFTLIKNYIQILNSVSTASHSLRSIKAINSSNEYIPISNYVKDFAFFNQNKQAIKRVIFKN